MRYFSQREVCSQGQQSSLSSHHPIIRSCIPSSAQVPVLRLSNVTREFYFHVLLLAVQSAKSPFACFRASLHAYQRAFDRSEADAGETPTSPQPVGKITG